MNITPTKLILGLIGLALFIFVVAYMRADAVGRDQLLCQANGGVPIMNADRTQMIDCKVSSVVVR